MREAKLKSKLVSIAETRWGQAIVDRQWWEKLEEPLEWKLVSYSGRFTADFFTVYFGDGVWDGLSQVTADMRNSIMIALGQEDLVRAEREGEIARLPLAPVVDFPSQR